MHNQFMGAQWCNRNHHHFTMAGLDPPVVNIGRRCPSFLEAVEDLAVEQFIAQLSVEALAVAILPIAVRQPYFGQAHAGVKFDLSQRRQIVCSELKPFAFLAANSAFSHKCTIGSSRMSE